MDNHHNPLLEAANSKLQNHSLDLTVDLRIIFPGELKPYSVDDIYFNGSQEPVKAAFVLIRTRDGKETIICHHSVWDHFINEVERMMGRLFMQETGFDKLRQDKNRNRD